MQSANDDIDGIICTGEPAEQLASSPAVPVRDLNLS